jgi:phosphoserine phosphatase RsbU/P
LRVKRRLLGGISVSKKFMGQDYEPVDLELLNIIVQQLSIAVNNYYLIKDLKDANFQLNRKLLELETLYDLGIAIGSIMEVEELAEQILMNAVGLTDASAGLLALRDGEGLKLASSINLPSGDLATLESYEPVKQALEERESLLDNSGEAGEHPYGFRKLMIVPLSGQHAVKGIIALADKESRDGLMNFSQEDLRMLRNFATQAGVAIENAQFYKESVEKERLERELQVAATIQRTILPKEPPKIPGMEIAATTIPSRFVGGDHYDFHKHDGGYLFTIADVSGKGIPAALLVSTLHATQHALVESGALDYPQLIKRISQSIYKSTLSNKFITFFLTSFDSATGRITTVNAGHNYPLLISADGSLNKLKKGGLVLGMLPDSDYEQESTELQPGDLLVMFTDGVTEAMDPEDEEYGDERLERLLLDNRHRSAAEIFDTLMEDLRRHTAGAPQHDDITLIVCKYSGNE